MKLKEICLRLKCKKTILDFCNSLFLDNTKGGLPAGRMHIWVAKPRNNKTSDMVMTTDAKGIEPAYKEFYVRKNKYVKEHDYRGDSNCIHCNAYGPDEDHIPCK